MSWVEVTVARWRSIKAGVNAWRWRGKTGRRSAGFLPNAGTSVTQQYGQPPFVQAVFDNATHKMRLALVVRAGAQEVLVPTDAEFAFRPSGSSDAVTFGRLMTNGRIEPHTAASLTAEARRRLAAQQERGESRRNRRRA